MQVGNLHLFLKLVSDSIFYYLPEMAWLTLASEKHLLFAMEADIFNLWQS